MLCDFVPHSDGKYKCLRCEYVTIQHARPPIRACNSKRSMPAVHAGVQLSRLAVVTCFFDPHNTPIRLANYFRFVAGMKEHGIDVYTVEGVMPGCSPILRNQPRHTAYDVSGRLWHKERLLNLGIAALPSDVDAVGWFDCDLLFSGCKTCKQRSGLRAAILKALGRNPVVQPWSQAEYLYEADRPIPRKGHPNRYWKSMALHNYYKRPEKRTTLPGIAHPGFAWAARRETLDQIGGLFDLHPLGGADTMMAAGFYGHFDSPFFEQYNQPMLAAWRPWAERAYDVVQGQVGWIDATVSHLWHGSIASRQYAGRNRIMRDLDLDPVRHLRTARNGTLAWADDAPIEIREYAVEYFRGRDECSTISDLTANTTR